MSDNIIKAHINFVPDPEPRSEDVDIYGFMNVCAPSDLNCFMFTFSPLMSNTEDDTAEMSKDPDAMVKIAVPHGDTISMVLSIFEALVASGNKRATEFMRRIDRNDLYER
jgi:hypothetical protein